MPCDVWADHEWEGKTFIEAGRHPTLGAFQKYGMRCRNCGRRTFETLWLSVPVRFDASLPVERVAPAIAE